MGNSTGHERLTGLALLSFRRNIKIDNKSFCAREEDTETRNFSAQINVHYNKYVLRLAALLDSVKQQYVNTKVAIKNFLIF